MTGTQPSFLPWARHEDLLDAERPRIGAEQRRASSRP